MARVTVEDCIVQVPNRFDLVMVAAQRAREISAGAALKVDRDNDKNPVVALREIADRVLDLDGLRDTLVRGLQKHVEMDEPEEEIVEFMAGEEEFLRQSAVADGAIDVTAGTDELDIGEDAAEEMVLDLAEQELEEQDLAGRDEPPGLRADLD